MLPRGPYFQCLDDDLFNCVFVCVCCGACLAFLLPTIFYVLKSENEYTWIWVHEALLVGIEFDWYSRF